MTMANPNVSWSNWKTVRLIGKGSFGTVYEIQHDLFGDIEKAALKVISIPQNVSDIDEMYSEGYDEESITSTFQSYLESIVAEYSLMRKMEDCTNIVNCDDVDWVQHDDGIGWDILIKMELLTPLTKALSTEVSEENVVKIAKDICAALEQCKEHGIVHRDIKPQNIFLSPNGNYKLGDFGIAKIVERTMGGTKIGTYKYMAPEVYNNKPYGSAADIYSLGLVLYWLLNERRMPFLPLPPVKLSADMDEAARNCRLSGEQFAEPKNGSKKLKAIVMKACAYDVADRYTSASDMLLDLNQIGQEYSLQTEETDCKSVNVVIPDDQLEGGTVRLFIKPATETIDEKPVIEANDEKPVTSNDNSTENQKQIENEPVDFSSALQQGKKLWIIIGVVAAVLIAVIVILLPSMGKSNQSMIQDPSINIQENQDATVAIEGTNKVTQLVEHAQIIAVDTSWTHVVALRSNGTVSVVVEQGRDEGQSNTDDWENIISVCAGYFHTVGLEADGTVVAVGSNAYGQCDVSEWTNIIAISAGDNFTVGLKSDGTVVATGENDWGQCDVSGLRNIVFVEATDIALQCLDADGNWIKLGWDSEHKDNGRNLGVIDLGAGHYNTVGLNSDGTAKFIIKDETVSGPLDISQWNDLIDVIAGVEHVVGLKSDGTVVAIGKNEYGECNVGDWMDIVAISAAYGHTVGVKRDGTVVATGIFINGGSVCDVSVLNEGAVLAESQGD